MEEPCLRSVVVYKVEKETQHLGQLQEQVHDAEKELLASRMAHNVLEKKQTAELEEKTQAIVAKNEALESEYEEKKKQYNFELSYLKNKSRFEKTQLEMGERELDRISRDIEDKRC